MQTHNLNEPTTHVNQYTLCIMAYYLFAPMEDLLTSNVGTLAKYIAIFIVFFGLIYTGGAITFKSSPVHNCIIYLMILSVASCIWATDPAVAIHRNVAYLLVPGLAFFVGQLEFSAREQDNIITAAIVGGALTVGYLIFKGQISITGIQRLNLTDGNDQNGFAANMLLPFCLCIMRALKQKGGKRILYVGLGLLFLYVILLTGSRGALLGMFTFTFVYIFFSEGQNRGRTLVIVLAGLVLAYFVVLPLLPEYIQTRLFNNDSYMNTINAQENRVAFWRTAFTEIFPKHPLLGVGSGCTPLWLGKFFSYNRGMHNTYINMLCEYGVLGLPVFLRMLYGLFMEKKRQGNAGEIALLACICVIIFFLDAYPKKYFWNVIMLLMIDTVQPEAPEIRHSD